VQGRIIGRSEKGEEKGVGRKGRIIGLKREKRMD
jgi:hypothetical protein